MAAIWIDRERCVGCGLCVRACPQGAASLSGGKACVGEGCIGCGFCLSACPKGALKRREPDRSGPSEGWRGVLTVAEVRQGEIQPAALELLGKARQLALQLGGAPVSALLLAEEGQAQAQTLIDHGADVVYLRQGPGMNQALEDVWTQAAEQAVRRAKPEILLFSATEFGRSLAPRLAARLQTGLTADCTALEIDGQTGLLRQTRPAFGGNLMATIQCPAGRPQMATVRPGTFALEPPQARQGQVETLPETPGQGRVQLLSQQPAEQSAGIETADIIVAAGRGIGAQKNMEEVYRLARLLGGQAAVSRPLADAGWAPYERQVGQTGKTVAPKLYLAFGISGAVQHLAGVGGAETVVAVNSDPEAPIFQSAHYAVVGDCLQVIRRMIRRLEG